MVGDMMALNNLPGVAQVAMQGGTVRSGPDHECAGCAASRRARPFKYFDKGSMATISRFHAGQFLSVVQQDPARRFLQPGS